MKLEPTSYPTEDRNLLFCLADWNGLSHASFGSIEEIINKGRSLRQVADYFRYFGEALDKLDATGCTPDQIGYRVAYGGDPAHNPDGNIGALYIKEDK
jgi:hypothetical protein